MRIRSPSLPDRDALLDLIGQGGPFRPEEVSCATELLEAALAQAEGNTYEALVATADERDDAPPIGYVCFGKTPMTERAFDLYWIVVGANMRGRGVGRALLQAVEAQLRDRGAGLIRIETSSLEGQGGAARFYANAGYQQAGYVEGFYREGDHLITFIKRLDA
jgi:ribosomal protein S18 acetylase RimI-like enzyme